MRAFTLAQRPAFEGPLQLEKLDERLWPEFMPHGDMNDPDDFSKFDAYQFAFINESDQVRRRRPNYPVSLVWRHRGPSRNLGCGVAEWACQPRGYRRDGRTESPCG